MMSTSDVNHLLAEALNSIAEADELRAKGLRAIASALANGIPIAPASAPVKVKAEKRQRDPNLPKRPQSAFFLFMNDFRQNDKYKAHTGTFNEKSVYAGEVWKSLPESEKAVYMKKADKLKEAYHIALNQYKAVGGVVHSDGESDNETVDAPAPPSPVIAAPAPEVVKSSKKEKKEKHAAVESPVEEEVKEKKESKKSKKEKKEKS